MSTPKRDACAACVSNNYKPQEPLTVHPAITTIRGTRYCAVHARAALERSLMGSDIDADTNQILADVELEQKQGMPR